MFAFMEILSKKRELIKKNSLQKSSCKIKDAYEIWVHKMEAMFSA